jgi:hypothetical protein
MLLQQLDLIIKLSDDLSMRTGVGRRADGKSAPAAKATDSARASAVDDVDCQTKYV